MGKYISNQFMGNLFARQLWLRTFAFVGQMLFRQMINISRKDDEVTLRQTDII